MTGTIRNPGCSTWRLETASCDISTSFAPFSWMESRTLSLVLMPAESALRAWGTAARTCSRDMRKECTNGVDGSTSPLESPRGGKRMNCCGLFEGILFCLLELVSRRRRSEKAGECAHRSGAESDEDIGDGSRR